MTHEDMVSIALARAWGENHEAVFAEVSKPEGERRINTVGEMLAALYAPLLEYNESEGTVKLCTMYLPNGL